METTNQGSQHVQAHVNCKEFSGVDIVVLVSYCDSAVLLPFDRVVVTFSRFATAIHLNAVDYPKSNVNTAICGRFNIHANLETLGVTVLL
jgi:hypothetical protein